MLRIVAYNFGMEFIKYIVAPFVVIYGLLAVMAGPQQWRKGNIPAISANAMLAAGLLLITAGVLVWLASSWALWVLAAGLVGMQVVAIANGLHMHGKITWSHHLGRLVLSLGLFGLAYLGLSG
jgi:hypothetical protein